MVSVRQQVLEHVTMFEILSHYNLYSGKPRLVSIPCPFHEDIKPSMRLYPDTGLGYCYSCVKHFSPIDLVKLQEGLSYWEAVSWLEVLYGFKVVRDPDYLEETFNLKEAEDKEYKKAWEIKILELKGFLPFEIYHGLFEALDAGLDVEKYYLKAMRFTY